MSAIPDFTDESACHDFLVALRWPDGVRCVHCGTDRVGKLSVSSHISRSKVTPGVALTRRVWNCKMCKKQFTIKTGTAMAESSIPLGTWLATVYLLAKTGCRVTTCEIARQLEVTQKTAWFMKERIPFVAKKRASVDARFTAIVARIITKRHAWMLRPPLIAKETKNPIKIALSGSAIRAIKFLAKTEGGRRSMMRIIKEALCPCEQS